jgi:hypothetical protein
MTMATEVQTEASALPRWMLRDVEELARRISRDPQAWQLFTDLRKLGLEMVITVQPITSTPSELKG